MVWPYGELTLAQDCFAGDAVRFERGGELHEALLIPDPTFLRPARAAPHVALRFPDPRGLPRRGRPSCRRRHARGRRRDVLWGMPLLAALVTPLVPVAWEATLGRSAVTYQAPPERRCNDPARARRSTRSSTSSSPRARLALYVPGLRGGPDGRQRARRARGPHGGLPRPARPDGSARRSSRACSLTRSSTCSSATRHRAVSTGLGTGLLITALTGDVGTRWRMGSGRPHLRRADATRATPRRRPTSKA